MDGGYTGRSLSLVCRFVREASSACKYNSIAIRGFNQAEAFGNTLSNFADPPKVHHLFVAQRNPRPPPSTFSVGHTEAKDAVDALFDYELSYLDFHTLLMKIAKDEPTKSIYYYERWQEQMNTIPFVFHHIIPILAPYLTTLTCVNFYLFSSVLPVPFPHDLKLPRLMELTLYCCNAEQGPSLSYESGDRRDREDPPFPALKAFHLAFCDMDPTPYFNLDPIPYLDWVPAVTDLRVTGYLERDRTLIPSLQHAVLSPDSPDPTLRPNDHRPLQHLEHVSFLLCKDEDNRGAPVPRWLADLIVADQRGMINLLPVEPPQGNLEKPGLIHPAYPYKLADAEDDWKRGVERFGPCYSHP